MPLDWSPLWLSLHYAGLATVFSMLLALPMAWLLAQRRFPGSELLDAAATLPFVLPPAVLVYYLLATLGRWNLTFSWHAAIGVSAVYTLPVLLHMMREGFEAVDYSFENSARVLGAGEWRTLWRVTLPLAWRGLFAAAVTGFVRAFADFGATAIVAGNARSDWLLLPVAAVALAGFYFVSRVRRGPVWA
jgi:molybdate transport system permease protein